MGCKKELDLLLKKTNKSFLDNNEFIKMKKYIFEPVKEKNKNIEEFKGKYYKGIYYYYSFCSEYNRGNISTGNIYADKAAELIPEKILINIINRKKREYEKEN